MAGSLERGFKETDGEDALDVNHWGRDDAPKSGISSVDNTDWSGYDYNPGLLFKAGTPEPEDGQELPEAIQPPYLPEQTVVRGNE